MSLNKTRKRAIARARRRENQQRMGLSADSAGKQMAEAFQHICRAARAFCDGMAAFSRAFRESMQQ